MYKGIIALDIDGTITIDKHTLNPKVSTYLNKLIHEGWRIVFITGRTFSFAHPTIAPIAGTYWIAVQNGAALFEMPSEKWLKKHYIPSSVVPSLDALFKGSGTGLLIESGKEKADICYYKPSDFSQKELDYSAFRISISPERWQAVESFSTLPISDFAVGKYFATEEESQKIVTQLHTLKNPSLESIVIRDPFRIGGYVTHINMQGVSKGTILAEIKKEMPIPTIAAGDDYNDVDMLEQADIKIVMGNAPLALHSLADIIAPPAADLGIIDALEKAIGRIGCY